MGKIEITDITQGDPGGSAGKIVMEIYFYQILGISSAGDKTDDLVAGFYDAKVTGKIENIAGIAQVNNGRGIQQGAAKIQTDQAVVLRAYNEYSPEACIIDGADAGGVLHETARVAQVECYGWIAQIGPEIKAGHGAIRSVYRKSIPMILFVKDIETDGLGHIAQVAPICGDGIRIGDTGAKADADYFWNAAGGKITTHDQAIPFSI